MGLQGRHAHRAFFAATLCALVNGSGSGLAQTSSTAGIEDALQNITTLSRPGRIGYATFWDGNKYVQCRRQPDRSLRCEAAGTTMQPSMRAVLTGERQARLTGQGWILDAGFGNYVRTFAAEVPTAELAGIILRTLAESYAVDITNLEIKTAWVADVPCPPRNGFSQNLAGMVSDAPSMRTTAIHACSYSANVKTPQKATSTEQLYSMYGPTVAAEIQRLRVNAREKVWVVFEAAIGYVQCAPRASTAIYCEAQSAESWAGLAAILTPERVARLHKAGYASPGRAPNYWKTYQAGKYSDAAIAKEILTLLYEVYGYAGAIRLNIKTEG
jgi:hypothetical protein